MEYIERVNSWWRSLTEEQKRAVPTSKNSIDLHDLFSDVPESYFYIRQQLKEDINRIDIELKQLGVLFDVELYRERLLTWWQSLTDSEKKSVPTSGIRTIDLHDLFSDVPIGYFELRRYLKEDIKKIDEELKDLGVLFDVNIYKNRLLKWWKVLTDEQKKDLSIVNNTIDLRNLYSDVPIQYHSIRKHLISEIEKIDTELKALGVIFDVEAYRDLLNNWWQSLTDDKKKLVSVSRNSIDLRDFLDEAPIGYHHARYYLKEDIGNIDKDLIRLGILYNDEDEVIVSLMRNFISECEITPSLLWDVELAQTASVNSKLMSNGPDRYFEQFGLVSPKFLIDKLRCKYKHLMTPTMIVLRKKLNQLLLFHGVTLPYSEIKGSGSSLGYDLNHRRLFLKWKNSLSLEEKTSLPMIGRTISHKAFDHFIPTQRRVTSYPFFKFELQRFSKEVLELKGIDYKTIKERDEIIKEKALYKKESKRSMFHKLRLKKLISIDDFKSEEEGYGGVKHAFAVASLKATSTSGIGTYISGCDYYCEFLETKGITKHSSFRECFYSFSLRDFKEHLGEKISKNMISTSYANGVLSTLRMTLNKLESIRGFEFSYLPADGFETVRESILYKPYTPNERLAINKMLEQEMEQVKSKLEPYKKLNRNMADLDDPKVQARIIFEDFCNCDPNPTYNWTLNDSDRGQNKLISFVRTRRLSLVELYDEWRVLTRRVTSREIGVYVLKMAQVLGMNLASILDLEFDDYQEYHPLTNKPCLTYWKERSTGEKMLHLDLFHSDIQWITSSQKRFVEKTFNEVAKLTSEARKYVPDELSKKLFISYVKSSIAINDTAMSRLYSELVEDYQLKSDDGSPLVLSTTRFRPTLVSELIDTGVSIREIQYFLGHASIYTTMKYLDKLDFDIVVKEKARKAIEDIYSKTVHATNRHSSKKKQRRFDENQVIMKTPLGGCKNIFDPPSFIKKSSLYVKGKPCSQYNKCLSCENVMLTEKHIPELFAMQRDYLESLKNSDIKNTPYHIVVLENLSLLDEILNPQTSEFEKHILDKAKNDSIFIETTILDSWGG
jgi:integrase